MHHFHNAEKKKKKKINSQRFSYEENKETVLQTDYLEKLQVIISREHRH